MIAFGSFPALLTLLPLAAGGSTGCPVATASAPPGITGRYLEVRTCDVYTGPCFANAEENEVGKEATIAFGIERGTHDGVSLGGLDVVVLIRNHETLGKPRAISQPLATTIFVDADADDAQQDALVAFVTARLGDLAVATPTVRRAAIDFAAGDCHAAGCATLAVGDEVEVKTRCVGEGDQHCGNETLYYPPLTGGADVIPAVAEIHRVDSEAFAVRFVDRDSRGAMLGKFALAAAPALEEATPPSPFAFSALTLPATDEAAATYGAAALDEKAPSEVPEPFAKLLEAKGVRLAGGEDKPIYDVWLRADVPFEAKPKDALGVEYGAILPGTFVGVLRAHTTQYDYRENDVEPGIYAMRYALQPEDGDHVGTAPTRDFFLLTGFADDKDPAAVTDTKALDELSILASSTDHPLICHLRRLDGEVKERPALRHDEANKLWILDLLLRGSVAGEGDDKARAKQELRAGLVLIGVSDSL
jgi:hypothetical protein